MAPKDLEDKSVLLAAHLLELVGKAEKGNGIAMAMDILESKRALKKFYQIMASQGRKKSPLSLAKFSCSIKSVKSGKIESINNKTINHLSRILGCPVDKGAGIYLYKHKHEKINKGDSLVNFYSESNKKLQEAKKHFHLTNPFIIK